MKCVAIALMCIGSFIVAGHLFHWTRLFWYGIGFASPYISAILFGHLCTFANGVTYIVLHKAGLWNAVLQKGGKVKDRLKAWYDKE